MNIHALPSIIAAITNLTLGIFVYLRGKGKKINLLFGLMSLAYAWWNFGAFMLYIAPNKESVLSLFRPTSSGMWFIPPLTFHFIIHLGKDKSKISKIILSISYLLGVISLISSWVVKTEFIFFEYGKYLPKASLPFALININIGVVIYGLYLLTKRYKKLTSAIERVQIKYFFLGITILFLCSLTDILTGYNIKVYSFGQLGTLFYLMCVSYSIIRHRLFDIDMVINKIILFVLFTVFIVIFHIGLIKITSYLVTPPSANFCSIILLVFIFFFTPLRFKLSDLIDRVVYHGRYDYQNILRNTSKALVSLLNLEELLNYLTTTMANVVGVRKVCVLLEKIPGNFSIQSSYGLENELVKDYSIKVKNGIVGWMKKKKDVFVKEEQERELSPEEFKAIYGDIEKIGADISIPLFYKERLLGIITLDSKISGKIYNPADIDILNTIASQTAIALENARIYDEAITDGSSGLYNHKYFIFRLNKEVERARRYNLPLSLLMMDIDHFKNVNDKFGHLVGSMVVRKMGKIIKALVKEVDIPCQYGGEEFTILLPHTELEEAKATAYKLNKTIQDTEFSEEKSISVKITVSIGVSSLSEDNKDKNIPQGLPLIAPLDFLKLADTALYKAKEKGRNKVEVM
ncbi:MAG: diguanylate cyclase [Candidatus Firestonebacteria bacterium]